MQGRVFQNTLVQLKREVQRTLGVIDDSDTIIACSDEDKIGNTVDNIFTVFSATGEVKTVAGACYKKIETFSKCEFVVFCEGDDDIARNACSFLAVNFLTIKQYYDEKYDKASFVKNIIVDNVLPGDVLYRTKELHINVECPRVVYLIRVVEETDQGYLEILNNLFPDKANDYVIRVDERDAVVVKEFRTEPTKEEIMVIAQNIFDTLGAEAMITPLIGISTLVERVQDLSQAYRESRIALEVGKVFDTEKDIISYDNLGIGRLIYQLPTTLCELFLDEVFKKDSLNVLDSETIYTIQKFFENNLNVSETSRKLFVHRNTLVYRLDKIKKLTGLDLREFDDAIIFKVAMMVNKYLSSQPTRL